MPPWGPDLKNKIILFYSILFCIRNSWILLKVYVVVIVWYSDLQLPIAYAISAYHHWSCEFETHSSRDVLDTTLCDQVCQ